MYILINWDDHEKKAETATPISTIQKTTSHPKPLNTKIAGHMA
jgi:hypothetical protein